MERPEIIVDLQKLFSGGVSVSGWAGDAGAETVRYFAEKRGVSEEQILNAVALDTARGFLSGELTWSFGDWVANMCLFRGNTDFGFGGGTEDVPALWWEVYLTFDHSETVDEDRAENVAREALIDALSSCGIELTQIPRQPRPA